VPDVCRAWRGGDDDPGGGAWRTLLRTHKHDKEGGDNGGGVTDGTEVAHRCARWWCLSGCRILVQASRAPNEAAARAMLPAALCGRCLAPDSAAAANRDQKNSNKWTVSQSLAGGGGLGTGAGTRLNLDDLPLAKQQLGTASGALGGSTAGGSAGAGGDAGGGAGGGGGPAPLRHGPNGAPAAALVVFLADTDGAYDPVNLMRLLASAEINMPWLAKGGYPVILFHRDTLPLGEYSGSNGLR